ncbi:hypothetical protein SDC9_95381 [bioreactor metagenome]|uniref:Uncharacterized protein n=1 Tax=bioreactor metagenome TaxID=1076179 RepID=A0A645A652_9ZZZZ
MEPGDLLRDVGHALHVAPPGGDGDDVAIQPEVQLFKNRAHFGLGNVSAEQGVDPLGLQLQGGGCGVFGDNVHHAVHDLARTQQLHQLAGPLNCLHGIHEVQPLFIAGGGLGAHVERHGGAAHGRAAEVGGLK